MNPIDAIIRDHAIIVFDGVCVLCSAHAQFMLKYDRRCVFHLAAMQGEVGAALMRRAGLDPADPASFVVFDQGQVLMNSDALIHIWTRIGWPWRIAALGKLIPRMVRDALYGFVARHRYRIFGQRETCWVPDAQQAARIL